MAKLTNVAITDHTDEVRDLLKGASRRAAQIMGEKIKAYARQRLGAARGPLGNPWPSEVIIALRAGMHYETTDDERGLVLRVGNNMQIAPYIELGTGKLYDPPPEWLEYHGDDAHSVGGLDWWMYYDPLDDEIRVGKPVPATPYLRPAILDHVDEYKELAKRELENA